MELACSHFLLLVSLLLPLVPPQALATSGGAARLGKGRNLTDGETLASAGGGTFTLGFFSPGASTTTTRRYLGIWFTVSPDAISWVANRDRPLNDKSGRLVFTDTGNLLLLDGSGRTAWSSNSTSISSRAQLQLLDSGNLVVRDDDQAASTFVSWQSFDHPSDTLLAGMKVGKNLWTGADWSLASWRWPDDPSPGNHLRVLNSSGIPDFVLYQGDVKKYRTGPWNGLWFSGVPEMATYANLITCQVTISSAELTYWYTQKPHAPLTRIFLTDTGTVKRMMWDATTRVWRTFFEGPRDVCDSYGKCGAFGLCDASAAAASTSFCSCLRGFSPASPPAWSLRDTSGGCRRNVKLDCSSHDRTTTDGFVLVSGVKLPDTQNASVDTGITLEECRTRCLADCSCLAYTAANIRGGGGGKGCIIWRDTILDLRLVDRGQDLYLRLAKSELLGEYRSQKSPIFAIIVWVAPAVAILLLLFMVCWGIKYKLSDFRSSRARGHIPTTRSDLKIDGFRWIDLATIKQATNNFGRMIGQGGCAAVYEAQWEAKTVAVKRFGFGKSGALNSRGRSDFAREVEVMARLRHGNLLSLLACCEEGDERILVYAFMPNKSLDLHIFGRGRSDRGALNWRRRLEIIRGIAQGVAYLHEGSGDDSVVHRDLKPSNVLLDQNWKAKIADFNTAKVFVADAESGQTLVFTPGYVCPGYFREGAVTLKSDVYSFGVTVLETLSGQRNGKAQGLIPRAWELWLQGRATDLLDEAVALPGPDSEIVSELERCVKIGLLCVQDSPDARPDMPAVVAMLTSKTSHIEQPKKPSVTGPPLHVTDTLLR